MSKIKIRWEDVEAIYDVGQGEHIIAHGRDYLSDEVELV